MSLCGGAHSRYCCELAYKAAYAAGSEGAHLYTPGRFGEVLIDTHVFRPGRSNKKAAVGKPEEQRPEPLRIFTQKW
uniref:Uncharacterized protein n=1 Tax=Rangifer tarandus platyrhynchus TaxID=3082113 RepID=A0ACB0EEZ2_RANTA|nr:unnamed protein product [Rangifer tarandus platyrhynchus]